MAGRGWPASAWTCPEIGPDLAAEPGRALGRLTDLGWGPRLRALLADDPAIDSAVPHDLIAAMVKVLAAWDWAGAFLGGLLCTGHLPVGGIARPDQAAMPSKRSSWITHPPRTPAVRVPHHEVCGPWSRGRG